MIEAPQQAGAAADVEQAGSRCRNCGASVAGAFCPQCGQETALRLPTLREFIREAAGRYVALDGRFWRTMRALVRPGFLTREYLEGRRRRYIRPARLYLFSTLIFFAVSRFFVEPGGAFLNDGAASRDAAKGARTEQPKERKAAKANAGAKGEDASGFLVDDDLSLHLPAEVGGAVKSLEKRWNRFNAMPRNEKGDHILAGVLRYGPYAMFALLPAFALLLKVFYLGPRRRYPHRPRLYGEHMVFAAHGHAFVFVGATLALLIGERVVRTAIVTWVGVYLLWSMHAVYGGSWVGVVLRSFCLFVAYSALLGIATAGLVIAAILLD